MLRRRFLGVSPFWIETGFGVSRLTEVRRSGACDAAPDRRSCRESRRRRGRRSIPTTSPKRHLSACCDHFTDSGRTGRCGHGRCRLLAECAQIRSAAPLGSVGSSPGWSCSIQVIITETSPGRQWTTCCQASTPSDARRSSSLSWLGSPTRRRPICWSVLWGRSGHGWRGLGCNSSTPVSRQR